MLEQRKKLYQKVLELPDHAGLHITETKDGEKGCLVNVKRDFFETMVQEQFIILLRIVYTSLEGGPKP